MSPNRPPLEVRYRKTAELVPYARNARTHSEAQVAAIAGSVKEFGFTNPVLIDEADGIIAGHGRILAAHLLKLEDVPTITLVGLTPAQKRAYIIADNKLALHGGWDVETLLAEVESLREDGFDVGLTGFTEGELEKLSSRLLSDIDEAAEEIDPDSFELAHRCPKCGFEFNDK